MESHSQQPLHRHHTHPLQALLNNLHTLLHSIAIFFLIHFRISFFFLEPETRPAPSLPWLLLSASELLLGFIWLLGRPFLCRPVSRTVFPENLPEDDRLPAIDVFICTADPEKEPAVDVMNTVISAMAMEYPPEKVRVYVSDDGGSSATVEGMREARRFAEWWVPFCKKYGVRQPCPEAYFAAGEDEDGRKDRAEELVEENLILKRYEELKKRLRIRATHTSTSCRDHPAFIQVIKSDDNEDTDKPRTQIQLPLLVYVSREKKTSHPHHFKAGALNTLLRVSGVISNSPYILVLDCDMYCNDRGSARRAMCFHLDPELSPSLAFVQFPQKFHTVSKNDIYDSQLRSIFTVEWSGMDGLLGPIVSGTCFYMKRISLYGTSPTDNDVWMKREDFGVSNKFIKSLGSNGMKNTENVSDFLDEETQLLASCTYENGSKWGEKVGFLYDSVVEDFFTSFHLHCKGWTSVFCNPERAQFLGNGTTKLNELLVQGTRWSSGLLEVGFSKFCPLVYGPQRMSLLQSMCYAELALFPLYCFPLWCFAVVPQLCLLKGIPLFPKVSSPFFIVFCFIFISSLSKHLQEVLISGGSVQKWINEQRMWMIKSVTCHSYGFLDAVMKKGGLRNATFVPTDKAVDDEGIKRYKMDIFDFQAATMFLAPMGILVVLNLASFGVGMGRVAVMGNYWEEMFGQIFLCFYVLLMSFPIMEAMVLRSDRGRFPSKVTTLSAIVVSILLYLG